MRRLLAVASLALLGACGARQNPRGVDSDDAIFKVKSNVAEANLYVDGRFVGPVGVLKGGIAVEPGTHRLELRHEDYFSAYVELDARKAERRAIQITLAPILP